MKLTSLAALLVLAFAPLAGCNTLQALGVGSGVAASLKGPLPNQATTLSEAIQTADLATNITKATVDAVHFSRPVLQEISALNDGIHSAIVGLENANANHQALDFAAFNAAVAAYNSYAAAHGIGAK
jgi:predicted small secreted protein